MPLDIKRLTFPLPFRLGHVNCYLIRSTAGYALVDTGARNARRQVAQALERAGCTPSSLKIILLTHGDFDHIGNAAFLRSAFRAPLAMHPGDYGMAERGDMFVNRKSPGWAIRTLLPLFTGFGPGERFTPDILLTDGQDLSAIGLEASVLSLPGHSRGSIGILAAGGNLFCGDLLENTTEPKLNSLMDDSDAANDSIGRLRPLSVTTVYPGHGEPFPFARLPQGPTQAS